MWNEKQIRNMGVSQLEERETTATRDVTTSVGQTDKYLNLFLSKQVENVKEFVLHSIWVVFES
jgi:hypothetical protein